MDSVKVPARRRLWIQQFLYIISFYLRICSTPNSPSHIQEPYITLPSRLEYLQPQSHIVMDRSTCKAHHRQYEIERKLFREYILHELKALKIFQEKIEDKEWIENFHTAEIWAPLRSRVGLRTSLISSNNAATHIISSFQQINHTSVGCPHMVATPTKSSTCLSTGKEHFYSTNSTSGWMK